MKTKRRRSGMVAVVAGVTALVLAAAYAPQAGAGGYYYYGSPYGYAYPDGPLELSRDMARLRDQMRRQQMQLQEQIRLQEEQIRLLRAQVTAQHQMTALQACYYRLNAGMDTCGDLFAAGSGELRACREKVVARNPGCARDVARPEPRSGG